MNFSNSFPSLKAENLTFLLLLSPPLDQYYKPGHPILFYTGNEGDIMMFYSNTGLMFELAEQWSALVIFGEHRFYGQSLPFGKDSFTNQNLGLLSVEQAMADYANFLTWFKYVYTLPCCFLSSNLSQLLFHPYTYFKFSYTNYFKTFSGIRSPSTLTIFKRCHFILFGFCALLCFSLQT